MRYTILLDPEPEEGGYSVTVPALPGCVTQGETIEEATEHAKEAIAGWVEWLVRDGEPVPVEEPTLIPVVVEVAVETGRSRLATTG